MKEGRPRVLLFIACLILFSISIRAEEGASLESAKFSPSDSLIQNLLLICDKGSLRYSLNGGGEKGIASMELSAGDKIINFASCGGAKQCRLAGAVSTAMLLSSVITASVTASDKTEQKEKIKLSLQGDETKVYLISSVPDLAGVLPLTIANGSPETQAAAPSSKTPELPVKLVETDIKPKGPTIEVEVVRNGRNDFTLNIVSKDETPIDFVEILENGTFMDVQICDKKTECAFSKNIKDRKPGAYKYVIKSMNIKEGISFYEETLSFLE
jgi:hypothetical protein